MGAHELVEHGGGERGAAEQRLVVALARHLRARELAGQLRAAPALRERVQHRCNVHTHARYTIIYTDKSATI